MSEVIDTAMGMGDVLADSTYIAKVEYFLQVVEDQRRQKSILGRFRVVYGSLCLPTHHKLTLYLEDGRAISFFVVRHLAQEATFPVCMGRATGGFKQVYTTQPQILPYSA